MSRDKKPTTVCDRATSANDKINEILDSFNKITFGEVGRDMSRLITIVENLEHARGEILNFIERYM